MDLQEEDKAHLINAHASAMDVGDRYDDWVKIDCEKDLEIRSMEDITSDILNEIL
jgi:hypothetical protein